MHLFFRLLPAIWLTVCRDRLGDRSGALGWHRLARQLAPDHPAVRHNDRYFGLETQEDHP